MNLQMNAEVTKEDTGNAQKMRAITENWAADNLYCPFCGNLKIRHDENNRLTADFYCPNCGEQYELRSKSGDLGDHIAEGAYDTMLGRINSENNPNFIFMHYNGMDLRVKDVVMVPKYFFVPEIIEKREPLSDKARQAGWCGCNIRLNQIPADGKVLMIKDEEIQPMDQVISQVERTKFISQYSLSERGRVLDVLSRIDKTGDREFTLEDVYLFEEAQSQKHLDEHYVKDKIQQSLQILTDKGMIEFCGNGCYRKISEL